MLSRLRTLHPQTVLLLSACIFAASLALSAYLLPDPVASHFDWRGQPRGWIGRGGYLVTMALVGLSMPVFMKLTSVLIRVLPPALISLPHRDYWLSPENREATNAHVAGQFDLFASLLLGFFAGVNGFVVHANLSAPIRLTGWLGVFVALFLIAVHIWALLLISRFSKLPAPPASST